MFGSSSSSSKRGGGSAPRPPASSFGEGLVGEISGDEALSPDQGVKPSKGSKPFRAPGEFTRMFGPADPSQAPPEEFIPAAHKGGGEGYASGLFRNPHNAPPPAASSGAPPAQGGQGGGPGEYTMAFERPKASAPAQVPQPAPAPSVAATPPPPAKTGPSKGMIVALIVAVLVAGLSLGAAVYMFLNRDSGPSPDTPPAAEQPAENTQ
ncbi:MAG: hypothetical protein R2748_06575 [Bryobacterales bacterium]